MRINKAIEVLLDSIPETAPDTIGRKEISEAYGIAIKAIETLYKPQEILNMGYGFYCPVCKSECGEFDRYCRRCGQRITRKE